MDMTSVPICPMWPGDAVVLIVAVVLPLAQPRRCASISALVAVVPNAHARQHRQAQGLADVGSREWVGRREGDRDARCAVDRVAQTLTNEVRQLDA